jgi:hypothetical protein
MDMDITFELGPRQLAVDRCPLVAVNNDAELVPAHADLYGYALVTLCYQRYINAQAARARRHIGDTR